MKKPFLNFIVLVLTAISLTSCEWNKDTPKHNDPSPEEIAKKWNNTKGKISNKEANRLEENYKKLLYNGSRDSLIDANGEVYKDTREVWFDIEELKNYIAYIEQHGKDNNYDQLGIRVYLGTKEPIKDGKAVTTLFFYGTGHANGLTSQRSTTQSALDTNIPGIDGLNKGTSGMPPKDLIYP
ncbi:hypothetical protein LY01_01573 [Nonlabens xylanidelens]|uniref:Lipoprotein n=1 Tax=Nonlabens xylanidelens TaxID=191564 RepID=A0A2S6IKZ2_9FLAO|nr:hypothetical protein [Nonlabens xylanidelens]PPK94820.1 hypothetical protein LY01_01573 [Nonlabens xylanidelens]PQJ17377.1 hypothetical protein BST94_09950 [Nonlabens xylanidelens]